MSSYGENNDEQNKQNISRLCKEIKKIIDVKADRNHPDYAKYKDKEIVFLLGAGASLASGVPLARDLRKSLMKGYQDLMETMLETKIGIKNINDASLEMIISLYNELHQDEKAGHNYLKLKCPDILEAYRRPMPFIYEVISHMFNFRIIRNIISLNFDELLERSLNDEVGEEGYEKVRTSAAFERATLTYEKDKRGRKRFLLKPHGTIGNRITMRHSWEEVTRLDKEAHQVIAKLMERTAILITIGYSFMDRDLRGLFLGPFLGDDTPAFKKLYIIDAENSKIEEKPPFKKLKGNKNIIFIKTGAEKFADLFAKDLFSDEWNDFYSGIQKHRVRYLLYKYLFPPKGTLCKKIFENYKLPYSIYVHLLIEILLFILSVKGKFRGNVVLESVRVYRYFRTIQGLYERERTAGFFAKDFSIRKALEVYAPAFLNRQMPENKLGEEDYYCEVLKGDNPEDSEISLINNLLKCLAKHLTWKFNLREHEVKFIDDDELKSYLKEVINLFDISLVERTNRLIAFKNPWILCTYRQFFKKTAEIIKPKKTAEIIKPWKGLSIRAETGEWIKRDIEKYIKKERENNSNYIFKADNVGVIINDYINEPDNSYHRSRVHEIVESLQGYNIDVGIIRIGKNHDPDTSHHFNINRTTQKAIYFYREGRSISICPIYLEDEEEGGDVDTVLRLWNELCKKADWNLPKSQVNKH